MRGPDDPRPRAVSVHCPARDSFSQRLRGHDMKQQTKTEARSYLFVPGNRPQRFAKALAAGADAVILDLEDAVGPQEKEQARDEVIKWLQGDSKVYVRINAADTRWFSDEVAALSHNKAVLGIV